MNPTLASTSANFPKCFQPCPIMTGQVRCFEFHNLALALEQDHRRLVNLQVVQLALFWGYTSDIIFCLAINMRPISDKASLLLKCMNHLQDLSDSSVAKRSLYLCIMCHMWCMWSQSELSLQPPLQIIIIIIKVKLKWPWATQLGKWIVCKKWQFWCHWLEVLICRLSLSWSPLAKCNGKRIHEEK